jgi:hypothetical protein
MVELDILIDSIAQHDPLASMIDVLKDIPLINNRKKGTKARQWCERL